jgi:hypothetical protein
MTGAEVITDGRRRPTFTGAAPTLLRRLQVALADPYRAVLAAVIVLVAAACLDVLGDPDVWWHIRLGQWILDHHAIPTGELFSYTAQGNSLTAHEWLADVIFAGLYAAGGIFVVAIAAAAAAWSGFLAIALLLLRRGVRPLAVAAALALGAKAAEPVLGTRPQVVTFALTAWTLFLADTYLREGGRRRWLIPPLMLVWANLHAGFVSGLGVLVAILAIEALRPRLGGVRLPSERLKGLVTVTAVAALAACVNPAGPGLYRFALFVSATESRKAIVEWQSPDFHQAGLLALLGLVVTLVVLMGVRRPDLRDAVLAGAGVALVLVAVRNTAVAVALILPAWATAADSAGGLLLFSGRQRRRTVTPATVGLGGVVLLIGVLGAGLTVARAAQAASPQGVGAAYPTCAARLLATADRPQRVFAAYGAAGFLILRDFPSTRVYEYGESISLGDGVFDDYVRIAGGAQDPPSAMRLLDASATSAVLVGPSALTVELRASPGWRYVTSDGGLELFVRGDPDWARGRACG